MEIDIKGEKLQFEIGSIWAVVYDFETLTDGRLEFDMKKTLTLHVAMYGVLLRKNPGMTLLFDEFVEELNHMELAKAMTEYFVKRLEILSQGETVASAVRDIKKQQKGQAAEAEEETAPDKKKATGGEASTDTPCIERPLGITGWLRRIFSGS